MGPFWHFLDFLAVGEIGLAPYKAALRVASGWWVQQRHRRLPHSPGSGSCSTSRRGGDGATCSLSFRRQSRPSPHRREVASRRG